MAGVCLISEDDLRKLLNEKEHLRKQVDELQAKASADLDEHRRVKAQMRRMAGAVYSRRLHDLRAIKSSYILVGDTENAALADMELDALILATLDGFIEDEEKEHGNQR